MQLYLRHDDVKCRSRMLSAYACLQAATPHSPQQVNYQKTRAKADNTKYLNVDTGASYTNMRVSLDRTSLTASIIDVTSVSEKVLLNCFRLRNKLDQQDQQTIAEVIAVVEKLLEISTELKDVFNESTDAEYLTANASITRSVDPKDDSLIAFQSALKDSYSILEKILVQLEPLLKPGFQGRLKWPIHPSRAERQLDVIRKHDETIRLTLSSYQARLLEVRTPKPDSKDGQSNRSDILRW